MASSNTPEPQIVVLDFGGQYAGLIEKRVRGLGVSTRRVPGATAAADVRRPGVVGVIGSGGPDSVYADGAPQSDPVLFDGTVPYLGICYGMQLLARAAGGEVLRKHRREDGDTTIRVADEGAGPLFAGLPAVQQVWMSHGDSVDAPPPGFAAAAITADGLLAAIAGEDGRRFGVQFHPEVNDTPYGAALLSTFVLGVCGALRDLDQAEEIEAKLALIREVVGDDRVLVFLSGGVDSSVAALLCLRALRADQVVAVHVDHGFMRDGESDGIVARFADFGFTAGQLILAREAEAFAAATTRVPPPGARQVEGPDGTVAYEPPRETWPETRPLRDETDPQAKRLIIGDTFMRVARRQMDALGMTPANSFLCQGTLYTDLIESGSDQVSHGGSADVIKFHHNDTPLVRQFRRAGRVLEPNASWYKDDVRRVARALGLGADLALRRPFPGPGLAIRLLCADDHCEVPGGLADLARSIDRHVADLDGDGFLGRLIPVATVGVQGDARTYAPAALLLARGDLADPATWERAMAVATALPKREDRINRVVVQIGVLSNPPRCPGWSGCAEDVPTVLPRVIPTRLRTRELDLLRAVHRLGEDRLRAADPDHRIAQMPLVLFPADLAGSGDRSVAIRAIVTEDFMTGRPAVPHRDLPWSFFAGLCDDLLALHGVGAVVVDLSTKPPATTCWE